MKAGGTLLTASDEALAGQQGYIYESDRQLLTVWFPRASSNIDIQVTLGTKPIATAVNNVEIDIVLPANTPMSAGIYLASNFRLGARWYAGERISPTLARATIALTTDEVINSSHQRYLGYRSEVQ